MLSSSEEHRIRGEKVQIKQAWDRETSNRRVLEEKERKVFIVNLTPEIREEDIEEHFRQYGEIEEIRVIRNKEDNMMRGFGFVLFKSRISYNLIFENEETTHTIRGKSIECRRVLLRNELDYLNSTAPQMVPQLQPTPMNLFEGFQLVGQYYQQNPQMLETAIQEFLSGGGSSGGSIPNSSSQTISDNLSLNGQLSVSEEARDKRCYSDVAYLQNHQMANPSTASTIAGKSRKKHKYFNHNVMQSINNILDDDEDHTVPNYEIAARQTMPNLQSAGLGFSEFKKPEEAVQNDEFLGFKVVGQSPPPGLEPSHFAQTNPGCTKGFSNQLFSNLQFSMFSKSGAKTPATTGAEALNPKSSLAYQQKQSVETALPSHGDLLPPQPVASVADKQPSYWSKWGITGKQKK